MVSFQILFSFAVIPRIDVLSFSCASLMILETKEKVTTSWIYGPETSTPRKNLQVVEYVFDKICYDPMGVYMGLNVYDMTLRGTYMRLHVHVNVYVIGSA